MNIVDLVRDRARRAPEHVALVVAGRGGAPDVSIGYGELQARVDAHAADLREAGLVPGERCGLVAHQGPEFVTWALGVMAAGGCVVPIPDDHAGRVLEAFAARAHLHRLVVEAEGFRCRPLEGRPALEPEIERAFAALDPAYLRFTSGTTSERKGVVLGHETITARLAAANRALRIGPEDRVLWLLPMAHHFVVSILLYLRYGATILLPTSALARDVLDLAERAAATVFYASPYHYQLLAKDTSAQRLDGVRLAISTAEGLRVDVARRFSERYERPVAQALGIIEVGLPLVNLAHAAEKPRSVGRPLPDYDVWLRGENGKPVTATGETGELCIRGPGLFDAYLEPWTPRQALVEPDGFRPGDQGWFDADGDLHLVGRRTNRINMAGMKFFAEEVEAVLDAHPAVEASRVSAREHAALGEIPVAEVVAADPAHPPTAGELTRFCRESLPAYKVPRRFAIVEALEATATGKLRR